MHLFHSTSLDTEDRKNETLANVLKELAFMFMESSYL